MVALMTPGLKMERLKNRKEKKRKKRPLFILAFMSVNLVCLSGTMTTDLISDVKIFGLNEWWCRFKKKKKKNRIMLKSHIPHIRAMLKIKANFTAVELNKTGKLE